MRVGLWSLEGLARIAWLGLVGCLLGLLAVVGVAGASSGGVQAGFGVGELTGVSCSSMRSCIAVGAQPSRFTQGGLPVAGRWNGSEWLVQSVPIPPGQSGQLDAVSCPSRTHCMAVGSAGTSNGHEQALAEAWNDTSWSARPVPIPEGMTYGSELLGVSCPTSTTCEAVGYGQFSRYDRRPLAERWNGSRWSIQKLTASLRGQLRGVTCSTRRNCFAVGGGLIERWNGQRWSLQRSKGVGNLEAVSCSSAERCTAVGDSSQGATDIYRWNGKHWRIQARPHGPLGDASTLNGVSCPSRNSCLAVGDYLSDPGTESPIAARWANSRWSYNPTAVPHDDPSGWLNSIYCASKTACLAVGGTDRSTLASIWNGTHWSRISP